MKGTAYFNTRTVCQLVLLALASTAQLFADSLYLNTKKLLQGKWNAAPEQPGHEFKLTFQKDKFIWVDAIAEKDAKYEGRYSIEGNALILRDVKQVSAGDSFPLAGSIKCTLESNLESLEYEEKLHCEDASNGNSLADFSNTKARTKPGAERAVSDIPVVYAPGFKRPTATLVLRSMPDTSAEPLSWFAPGKGGEAEERKNLRKGEKIKVLARTIQKMAVGKMNNYWCYVEVEGVSQFGGVPVSVRGWAYGEFLK